jgi:hypothetical protein
MDLTHVVLLVLAALGQGRPSAPAAPAQDPDRPAISASEIKLLRDSNIFAPRGTRKYTPPPPRPGGGKSEPAAPPKPKPPLITGIFFDAKLQAYLVVVEDRNDSSLKQFKDPKFLKVGDEVTGYKVSTISAEKAVFLKGDASKELKVGESLPGTDGKPVSAATPSDDPEAGPAPEGEEKVEIKPLDPEKKSEVLESMKKARGKKNRPSNDE